MPKLVVSTVGTSLLTNQIEAGFDSDSWERQLIETVNASEEDIQKYHPEIGSILQELKVRARQILDRNDISTIRRASAELNGVYALCLGNLAQDDAHFLIATDTVQGKITATLLEEYLRNQGIGNTSILSSDKLSIASDDNFSQGIAQLLPELQEIIQGYKNNGYQVYFNLVGGFKALQGFFNVIGMFYANEIIYVFEGSNELIKIPKLPIDIKLDQVKPHQVPLAMMNAGAVRASWEDIKKIPSEWIFPVDQEVILSTWGTLVWNQCKNKILKDDKILRFPNLEYSPAFEEDYKNQKDNSRRIDLQETLAKVSQILNLKKDGITALKQDGGIQLSRYTNTSIDHFRTSLGLRVSCKVLDGGRLSLRYYGTHEHVEGKEGI